MTCIPLVSPPRLQPLFLRPYEGGVAKAYKGGLACHHMTNLAVESAKTKTENLHSICLDRVGWQNRKNLPQIVVQFNGDLLC